MRTYFHGIPVLISLAVLLGACGGRSAAGPEAGHSVAGRSPAQLELVPLDALGQPAPDQARAQLVALTGTACRLRSADESPGHSLYLELRFNPAHSAPALKLSETLASRALLFCQQLEPGRLQAGIAMLGADAVLPESSDLLDIHVGGPGFAGMPATVRAVSAAPVSAVADLTFDPVDVSALSWTYYNDGDYDQNGAVTIGDITPIGVNFGAADGDAGWNKARVADGDGNGEVGISDLTRIGLNFNRLVDSFEVREAAGAEGPFSATPGGAVPFESAPKPAGGGPRVWHHSLDTPVFGNHYVVVALDGTSAAADHSNVVEFAPDNLPPIASATHDSVGVEKPGRVVNFEASASLDPDGTIVEYAFDPEGDGTWPYVRALNIAIHRYSREGVYTPHVRVTDNEGATDTLELSPITIELGEPTVKLLYGGGDARDLLTASLIGDGRPAVVFIKPYELPFDVAYIVRASSTSAATWEAPSLAASTAGEVSQIAIASIASNLMAAFRYDSKLWRTYYEDGGSGGPGTYTLLSAVTDGPYQLSSIPLGGGLGTAYIAEGDIDSGKLYFNNFGGDFLLDGAACSHPSTARIFNNPTVAYTRTVTEGVNELGLCAATDFDGTVWPPAITVVTGKDVETAEHCMLSSIGSVIIAFWSDTDNTLYSIASEFGVTTDWLDPVPVDTDCEVGSRFCLRMISDLPCLVYPDGTELKYVIAKDYWVEGWNEPMVVATASGGFGETDLLDVETSPVIFYVDKTDNNVRAVVFE